MAKAVIIGASGFTGAELLRLCAAHPEISVSAATGASQAGTEVGDLYPSLRAAYGGQRFVDVSEVTFDGVDIAFLGLPHGASQSLVGDLRGQVGHIVDLAADFRLADESLYPTWYGEPHAAPELLSEFAYGLPEFFRADLAGAELIAAPGCYVTTSSLALGPLVKAGAIDATGIVVDAASGVSGAGRPPKPGTTFCAVDENFTAYGLLNHRHTPEIEMAVGRYSEADVQVLFTPHLAPMSRGILATCYARPTSEVSTEDVLSIMRQAYEDEPFVTVIDGSPATKSTLGSNSCHVTARVDQRTGWVVVLAALDNLVKGASGQAIQCANLALGLEETAGLPVAGVYP